MENLPRKVRSKKLNTKVDLTAMVSISFLLIIFFMVVGELSKPKIIALSLPDRNQGCGGEPIACYRGERFYTVLLGGNNKIISYDGLYTPIKKNNFSKNEFRTNLRLTNKRILEFSTAVGKPNRGAIVFIKPSKKSTYGDLVDIIEEMRLANIETYTIINEFTPEEEKLLASN